MSDAARDNGEVTERSLSPSQPLPSIKNVVTDALQPVVPKDNLPGATAAVTQIVASLISGPIPPADFVRDWAEIYP